MGVYQQEKVKGGDKYLNKKKKSGQIPAFGNWDYKNELPITQYFESARQAGLIRFSNVSSSATATHSGECPPILSHHLYAVHFHSFNNYTPPNPRVSQAKEYRMQPLKKEKKSKKEEYLTESPRPSKLTTKNIRGGGHVTQVPPGNMKKNNSKIINARAVDEDLYKIPPQLLRSSKRKNRLGIFSRCLVPDCMV